MKLVISIFLFFSYASLGSDDLCQENLIQRPQGTHELISYLSVLLDQRILDESELLRLLYSIDEGALRNPILESVAGVSSAKLIHRRSLQDIIDTMNIDLLEVKKWILTRIEKNLSKDIERNKALEETQLARAQMKFFPILAGRFFMGEKSPAPEVILTHDIEMMSTPVTQSMWVEIMKRNGAVYLDLNQSAVREFSDGRVHMSPDHPMENVTWWSTLIFANELSKLHGFEEAYDLSDLEFYDNMDPRAGKAMRKKGQVKINAPDGDIYRTEGYRLPTEAEMEYVLQNYFQKFSPQDFDSRNDELLAFFWFNSNTQSPMPVGEMPALILHGNPFYDLLGNIFEWTWDFYSHLLGGVNPVANINTYSGKVLKGGCWSSDARQLSPYYRCIESPDRHSGLSGERNGFRLVRTLNPKMSK